MKIISKKEAKELGLIFYFTGKPCPKKHISQRYVSSNTCCECEKEIRLNRTKEENAISWKNWYAKNKKRHYLNNMKYKLENLEEWKAYKKLYYKNNKEKIMANSAKHNAIRRAKQKGCLGSYTEEQISEMYVRQNGKCANCLKSIKEYFERDHIMPLIKGGDNTIRNIQLLCKSCNRKKHAKHPIEWARENGRLL